MMRLILTIFAVLLLCATCASWEETVQAGGTYFDVIELEQAKQKEKKAEKEAREKEWKENGEASVEKLMSSGGVLTGDGKYVLFLRIDTGVDGTGSRPVLNITNRATGETKEGKIRVSGNVSYDILSSVILSPATRTPTMFTGPAGTDTVLMGYRKTEYVGSSTTIDERKPAGGSVHVRDIILEEGYRLYSAKSGWTGNVFEPPVAPIIQGGRRWSNFSQFHPRGAAFSPDGKSFAVFVGYYTGEDDITIEQKAFLYSKSSSKPIRTFKVDVGKITQLRFSPDSKQLLAHANKEVSIFDVASGKLLDVVDE